MSKFIIWLTATASVLLLWTFLAVFSTTNGWFKDAMAPTGDTRAFFEAAVEDIDANSKGNAEFLLIKDGQVFDEYNQSVGAPVSSETLFQVASLSKWVTAFGVMTLVEDGKLDLDAPVSTYLTRWQLPENGFDNDGVTVRRLLSHMAGLTDGLGHNGFAPGVEVQPLVEHLTQAADAEPGVNGKVMVGVEPGSEFNYSGGGYNLLQLLIEEVSGTSFEDYMQQAVFDPLGMSQSTYHVNDSNADNLAEFYDTDGTRATHFRFTSLGATSLYTTSHDLFKFVTAHLPGADGEPVGRGALSAQTLTQMRQPHASMFGLDIWGLGAILFVANGEGDFIFGHDGLGGPAINTAARFNPATGDGIIILSTGNRGLASKLAGEWGFWQVGRVDFTILPKQTMVKTILAGWLVIFIASLLIVWLRRRAAKKLVSSSKLLNQGK